MYAVSNQEDLLLCGAGMRLCSRMLAGPQIGGIRRVVPGLSSEDCRLISADSIRHFPILVRADSDLGAGVLESSIEFSRVREFIFRSEDERNRVAHVRMRDVALDGMPTAVVPKLFELPDSALEYEKCDPAALAVVRSSNWTAGAFCGALAVVMSRMDVGPAMAPLFGDAQGSPINVFFNHGHAPNISITEAALLAACCDALTDARADNEIDPSLIADLMVKKSAKLALPLQQRVMKWRDWLKPRLDYQVSLEPSDFTDPHENQSAVLRAFTLLLFRKGLASLVGEKAKGRSAGPMVSILAAALAGFREGLDGIDIAIKQRTTGVVDAIACTLDATPGPVRDSLAGFFDVSVEPVGSRVVLRFLPTSHIVFDGQADNRTLLERIITLLGAGGLAVKRDGEFISIEDSGEKVHLRVEAQAEPNATPEIGPADRSRGSVKKSARRKSPAKRSKNQASTGDLQSKDVEVMAPHDDQTLQDQAGEQASGPDEIAVAADGSNRVLEEGASYVIDSESSRDQAIIDGERSTAVQSEQGLMRNRDGEGTAGVESSEGVVVAGEDGDPALRISKPDSDAAIASDSDSPAATGDLFGGEARVKHSRTPKEPSSGRSRGKARSRGKTTDA